MFHTWVQIWFQLEFPCNVPNLIKLMRGFFFFQQFQRDSLFLCPHPRLSLAYGKPEQVSGKKRSRSIPAAPFAAGHWAGPSGWTCQRWPVATFTCLPHTLSFPVPQFSLCSGMVRDLDLGTGARKVGQVKKNLKLNRNCVCVTKLGDCMLTLQWWATVWLPPIGQVQSFNTCFLPFQVYYQIDLSHLAALLATQKEKKKKRETADRREWPQMNWGMAGNLA